MPIVPNNIISITACCLGIIYSLVGLSIIYNDIKDKDFIGIMFGLIIILCSIISFILGYTILTN